MWSSDWPRIAHCVAQATLEITVILLPQPLNAEITDMTHCVLENVYSPCPSFFLLELLCHPNHLLLNLPPLLL